MFKGISIIDQQTASHSDLYSPITPIIDDLCHTKKQDSISNLAVFEKATSRPKNFFT